MDALIETALSVLPDADWAKIVGLLVIVFGVSVWTGRFKLEWIALGCRHVVRWLRCKIRNRHYWQSLSTILVVGIEPQPRTYQCRICGATKTEVFDICTSTTPALFRKRPLDIGHEFW